METTMSQETEIVPESALSVIIRESNLDKSKAQIILDNFGNYFEIVAEWAVKTKAIVITRPDQQAEMAMAKQARLFIRDKRIALEKKHKELKEASLREGQTLDSIKRILLNLLEPLEKQLKEKEDFAEIFEANRIAKLREERLAMLIPYEVYSENGFTLGEMDENVWAAFFNSIKTSFEQKKEAEKQAELQRLKQIELQNTYNKRMLEIAKYTDFYDPTCGDYLPLSLDTTETEFEFIMACCESKKHDHDQKQEEIKQENESLKKENEEREKAFAAQQENVKKEREAQEAKQRKLAAENSAKIEEERRKREKAEAELKAKNDAELKAKKESEKAARKAASAPDKKKLLDFAKIIQGLIVPDMKSEDGQKVGADILAKNANYANWIIEQANTL
jgi:hypothetical protein